MPKQYRENGSIYVFRPVILRDHNNRLGGKIVVYEMDYWSSFQLDTPEHAELLEWIMARTSCASPLIGLESVDMVVFDFDGVMTDNSVLVSDTGSEAVRCHRGDGWGIARLRDAGVSMMVLSTEKNPVVAARCAKLKLECLQGVSDKAGSLQSILSQRGVEPGRVAYLGNDVNDLDCMRLVGFPVAVADADPSVRAASVLTLSRCGGNGAVREFCDHMLGNADWKPYGGRVEALPAGPD
jgi:N-acylneuraminate cytidylyltransferase